MQSLIVQFLTICGSFLSAVSHGIIFTGGNGQPQGNCITPFQQPGICKIIFHCPVIVTSFHIIPHNICGYQGFAPIVCCPLDTDTIIDATEKPVPIHDVSPPAGPLRCGYRGTRVVFGNSEFLVRKKRTNLNPDLSLPSFIEPTFGPSVIGGIDALVDSWPWMALLGTRKGQKINWFCDGVLINSKWILTAAHCILRGNLDVVRLGEHDFSQELDGANPEDFEVSNIVQYPDLRLGEAYHDVALVELKKPVVLKDNISPVCLPWGEESGKSLVGQLVTLTGWGSTEFGGRTSPILQEVNITIFDTNVCDSSYSVLPDYRLKWPQGITSDTTICAGNPEGGKDACHGDSGGPIMYRKTGYYILAGIVSRGFGCGQKKYPGLYVAVNQPNYLSWIKKVAFAS